MSSRNRTCLYVGDLCILENTLEAGPCPGGNRTLLRSHREATGGGGVSPHGV